MNGNEKQEKLSCWYVSFNLKVVEVNTEIETLSGDMVVVLNSIKYKPQFVKNIIINNSHFKKKGLNNLLFYLSVYTAIEIDKEDFYEFLGSKIVLKHGHFFIQATSNVSVSVR